MGFRYVELSGAEYKPGMVKAYALYTDMRRTGFFECGHEKVQKLYENQVWGQKSNYVEVPTDCPQRDERMGYTGDGQVFALTGAYNFDTNDFWKNLNDFRFIIPAGFLFSTRLPVRFLKKTQGLCARNFCLSGNFLGFCLLYLRWL
mgnify:CR=1 FL=1